MENYKSNLAKFQTFIEKSVGAIVYSQAEGRNALKAKAKTKKIGPAGYQSHRYDRVSVQVKGGASNMDYGAESSFGVGVFRGYTQEQTVTYSADQQTYQAFTGQTQNSGAMTNLAREQEMLGQHFGERQEWWFWGNGTGTVGKITNASTTSLTIASTPDGTHASSFGVAYIETGVAYDVYRPSTGAVIGSFTIPITEEYRISRTANTIDLTSIALGASSAANDIIVFKDSALQCPYGLRNHVDYARTGFYQGYDTTGRTAYQSKGVNMAGRAMNNAFLDQGLGRKAMRVKSTKLAASMICTSIAQRDQYKAAGYGMISFTSTPKVIDTTIEGARGYGKDIEAFVSCDADVWYDLTPEKFTFLEEWQYGPYSSQNGDIWRQAASAGGTRFGRGEWFIVLGQRDQLFCEDPSAQTIWVNAEVLPSSVTLATKDANS